LYIREDGNIGIGTSTPGATLDVAGHIWQSNTGGSVMIGKYAGLYDDVTNNKNLFIGSYSGYQNTSGYGNVFLGAYSGSSNTDGYHNSIVGYNSKSYNSTGLFNTTIGAYSDQFNQNGDGNTVLGYAAGMGDAVHDKHYNIFIGYRAGFNETGSHKLYIENSDAGAEDALIYGQFDTDILTFNANVGIGTTSPDERLEIAYGGVLKINDIGNNRHTKIKHRADGNLLIQTDLGGIGFGTGGTADQIYIQDGGNLGIGNTNPASHCSNSSTLASDGLKTTALSGVNWRVSDYGGYAVGVENTATGGSGLLVDAGNNSGTGATVAHFVSNDASLMYIGENGNIGINTITPARKLHINDVMRIEPRDSAPSGASAGDLYFDGTTHKLRCYDGSVWQDCW